MNDKEMLIDLEMIFTGTQIAYFAVCPTKLWLFSHYICQEKNSELVEIGRLLQQAHYASDVKEILIDYKISIDLIRKKGMLILHEIKKSRKLECAHKLQMSYYLYYLRNVKGIEGVIGVINYPTQRKIVKVELTLDKEVEILEILNKIKRVISSPYPPLPTYKKYCRKCAYFEFCFGDN